MVAVIMAPSSVRVMTLSLGLPPRPVRSKVSTRLVLASTGLATAQQSSERILLTVNGFGVSQTYLEAAQARRQEAGQEITPWLIVNLVDELLLVQRGRELGYALSDEQFQGILDGIKEENNFDDEQLVAALERDEGMTLPELRDVMERQMLVGQVRQTEILGRVSITNTETREWAVSEYMNTLRNEAIIEWEDEGSKRLYDEFLANRPGA